jgi:hypothetical protein
MSRTSKAAADSTFVALELPALDAHPHLGTSPNPPSSGPYISNLQLHLEFFDRQGDRSIPWSQRVGEWVEAMFRKGPMRILPLTVAGLLPARSLHPWMGYFKMPQGAPFYLRAEAKLAYFETIKDFLEDKARAR